MYELRCGRAAAAAVGGRGGSSEVGRMSVTVHDARDVPTRERGGARHSQVRLMLLPQRKYRHRTKIRSSDDDNPKFDETFTFKVPPGRMVWFE